MAKKLIIGNFKQNPQTLKEAELLFREAKKVSGKLKNVEVVLCPSAPFIGALGKFKGMLGAQDVSLELEGAHTGEISPLMLRDLGVKYVIIGHSERRTMGESNNVVAQKIKSAFKGKLVPVVCVGESERDAKGSFWHDLKNQIKESLAGVQKSQLKDMVIAYEPVWAIGKSALRDATPVEIHEAKIFIHKVLSDMFGTKESAKVKIIYGGSVNAKNCADILFAGVDGLLPGRVSLKSQEFAAILKISNEINHKS
jgi:triosephosphate isomerase